MLECILDGGTATGYMGNGAAGLRELFQKDTKDSFTGLC